MLFVISIKYIPRAAFNVINRTAKYSLNCHVVPLDKKHLRAASRESMAIVKFQRPTQWCPQFHYKRERTYSSYSFLTSAVDRVSGQRHAPAALYLRYPLHRSRVCLRAGLDEEGIDVPNEKVWLQCCHKLHLLNAGVGIPDNNFQEVVMNPSSKREV
jgi:hypothetical protein